MTSQTTIPGCERTSALDSDVRYTPAWVVHALLDSDVAPNRMHAYVEPCAGDGAIIGAMAERGYLPWLVFEIRPECEPALRDRELTPLMFDFLEHDDATGAVGLHPVIMNPPFSLGHEFWAKCRRMGCPYVAALLRCNTIGSGTWADTWNKYPPTAIRSLRRRPSFTGDGKTDAAEYFWAVYRAGDPALNMKVI
jgi:hypothetical protein